MMSTEFSGVTQTTTTTLVEVTAEPVFGVSPNLEDETIESDEDKLMMTEYDEDNVIVIDLSEERNASAKNKLLIEDQPVPRQMFGSEISMESTEDNGDVILHSEPSEFYSTLFLPQFLWHTILLSVSPFWESLMNTLQFFCR